MLFSLLRFKTYSLGLVACALSLFVLSGCALKKPYYKTLVDLRNESSVNYSQQVLDAIVGVRDRASLPVFFSVEGGNASWAPGYSTSGTGLQFPSGAGTRGWDINESVLRVNLGLSESMSNAVQFNDFGSAAMTRVSALYAILCLPIPVGDNHLPNGALYAIVDEADSTNGFVIWTKTKKGTYLGVTEEKRDNFLEFARDVTYWTRNAVPMSNDLTSVPGLLYRFSIEYPKDEYTLATAVIAKNSAEASQDSAKQLVATKQQEYDALIQEAKTTKNNPSIYQTLLQYKRDELQGAIKNMGDLSAQIGKAQSDITTDMHQMDELIALFSLCLTEIKDNDPQAHHIDIDGVVNELKNRRTSILAGDFSQFNIVLPEAVGLDAAEPVDELYRERFESLPQQFEAPFQSLQ